MGVTSFHEVRNNSPFVVRIASRERPQQTGGGFLELAAGDWRDNLDIWIPWCTSAAEFPGHHLDIDVGGHTFAIWQRNVDGVDRVRVSSSGWSSPGEEIAGTAVVDGDRTLICSRWGLESQRRTSWLEMLLQGPLDTLLTVGRAVMTGG